MYTMEELKAAADRLARLEGCPFCNVLYEGYGKKLVVLPRFHGNKERGLAYMVQELEADVTTYDTYGASLFYIDDLNTGDSKALEEYKAVDVPIVARRWKEERELAERKARAEREAEKAAAVEAERTRFHGFTDGMTPMQKGKIVKTLDKLYRYKAEEGLNIKGGIMSRAVRMEQLYKAGCTVRTRKDAQGKTEYWVDVAPHRGYIVTKTEYEYFKYLESIDIPF